MIPASVSVASSAMLSSFCFTVRKTGVVKGLDCWSSSCSGSYAGRSGRQRLQGTQTAGASRRSFLRRNRNGRQMIRRNAGQPAIFHGFPVS